jgi:hypothetical protein
MNPHQLEVDMRTTLALIALALVALVAPVVSAQDVYVVKPEPAWCGGSWQPTSLQETVDDKGTVTLVPIPGTGGTNYAECAPITRSVKRMMEGRESEEVLSIPTYPAHPASLVTFQRDEKTGDVVGGRTVTTKDPASGEEVSRWMPIPPTVIKAQQ